MHAKEGRTRHRPDGLVDTLPRGWNNRQRRMKPTHTNVQRHCTKGQCGLQCCATNLQPYSRVPLSPDVPIVRSGLNSQGRSPQAPGGFALAAADVVAKAQAVLSPSE